VSSRRQTRVAAEEAERENHREAFKALAHERLARITQTGEAVTWVDMRDWLEHRVRGENLPRPQPKPKPKPSPAQPGLNPPPEVSHRLRAQPRDFSRNIILLNGWYLGPHRP
jgi:hypothetical protein